MDFTISSFNEPLDFDGSFTSVNAPAAQSSEASNTVSPRDIFMDLSAPNSNALTNMTTPSLYDGSPEDTYDASPLFGTEEYDNSNNWPSLFNDVQNDESMYVPAKNTTQSNVNDVSASTSMERTHSSTSSIDVKPSPDLRRMSLASGVSKHRRTGRDLPPIEVTDGDTLAMKRAKNTMAARKSRQKKRDIEEGLRLELAAMTAERDRWMHTAIAHGAPLPETKSPL